MPPVMPGVQHVPRVEAERAIARPTKGSFLSPFWIPNRTSSRPASTRNRRSSKLAIAVTVPALVAGAIAAGTAGAWPSHPPAQPASISRQTHAPAAAAVFLAARVSSGTPRTVVLDGFARPLTAPSQRRAQQVRRHAVAALAVRRKHHKHHHRHRTARQIARRMLHRFHWSKRQFRYLDWLWNRESSWNVYASNPWSGAYGIPQAVPGAKMASAGRSWQTSARVQIRWGLRYIRARYGSPRRAWGHEISLGWY